VPWCTGYVHLWTLAHRLLGDDKYLELANLAGEESASFEEGAADLCCGAAGQAYAFLNLYKHSGEMKWLHRAEHFANLAARRSMSHIERPDSLYKGELGVALLAHDLKAPDRSSMPLFEREFT